MTTSPAAVGSLRFWQFDSENHLTHSELEAKKLNAKKIYNSSFFYIILVHGAYRFWLSSLVAYAFAPSSRDDLLCKNKRIVWSVFLFLLSKSYRVCLGLEREEEKQENKSLLEVQIEEVERMIA